MMNFSQLIKNKKFQIIVGFAGIIAIGLTIYDSILSIKLSKMEMELKKKSDVKYES